MRILGIETSCDETAISLVSTQGIEQPFEVEMSVIASQIDTHAVYGGVVPEIAARQHIEAIIPMLREHISSNGEGIDAIAVTQGPGLAPALRVGVEVAKTLAWLWEKPLYPVSHMEGHIYASWLNQEKNIEFPVLTLTVSGGHTELILMKDHGMYERLGDTLDDAAGEAFDKTAKMLGLPYPGGPEIARLAEKGNPKAFDFPRGLLNRPGYDFSFSGLKTSVLYMLREQEEHLKEEAFVQDVAASVQEAIVDVLVRKTKRAMDDYAPKTVLLAGGVSANKALRERMQQMVEEKEGTQFVLLDRGYTTDNAAMIAATGLVHAFLKKEPEEPLIIEAKPQLDVFSL